MLLFLLYHVVSADLGRCVFNGDDKMEKTLSSLVGNNYSAKYTKNGQEIQFKVNFCGNGVDGVADGRNSMVYREEVDPKGTTFNGQTVGEALVEAHVDSNGQYTLVNFKTTSGASYPDASMCKNVAISTHIILTCADLYPDGTLRVLETTTDSSDSCLHLLELNTRTLCHFSFGVFLLRFLAAVAIGACVYFISGALYRRLRKGAQGLNQIPHLAFWSRVGNTIADKAEYLCRCTAPPSDEDIHERQDQPILPM